MPLETVVTKSKLIEISRKFSQGRGGIAPPRYIEEYLDLLKRLLG